MCLGFVGSAAFAAGALDEKIQIDIPPNTRMEDALIEWGSIAHMTVMINTATVGDRTTEGVHGVLNARKALILILRNSGLSFLEKKQTIQILPSDALVRSSQSITNSLPLSSFESGGAVSSVAPADDLRTSEEGSGNPGDDSARRHDVEQVVVTAQKRTESLQDVPVSVTAISAETLLETNQLRLQDYFSAVPGLTVVTGGFNAGEALTIRGVSALGGGQTVSVLVDDVPFGPTAGLSEGSAPDFDPADLARVEVLRGPQGTLYGASSIGGIVKFVTIDPSTSAFSGRIQAGTETVHNGAKLGYNVRGSINVPFSDTFAIRASAFTHEDPGYIDDPILHIEGVNKEVVAGGRVAALWKPSDVLSVKLSAMIQHSTQDGSPEVDNLPASLGDLQQSRIPNTGWFDRRLQVYSATITAKLGPIDLTSLTGYNVNKTSDSYDYSAFDGLSNAFYNVSGSALTNDTNSKSFTQELRLSSRIGDRFEWLLGAFYNHLDNTYTQGLFAEDPVTGNIAGTFINSDSFPTTYREYAGFVDLTYHFTDQFDVQIGGRESENKQSYEETIVGNTELFYGGPSPFVIPKVETKDNSFTYLVTPEFKVSPDLMLYARLASGYRPGGPNSNYSFENIPPSFRPDRTRNYEIGMKGDVLERVVSFDLSVYYVDWKDIQLAFVAPVSQAGYTGNGGRAKSEGAELAVKVKPLTGLSISSWISYDDAALTEDFPQNVANYGIAGNKLPFISRFSGNFSINQQMRVTDAVTGYLGGQVSYLSNRLGQFTATADRQNLPAYGKLDLRAGASYNSWSLDLFANNVTDKRGLLIGGIGTTYPNSFYYIQPRTIGVNLAKTF